jgi:3-oxoacyl-[acyl-carrier-protein] synthase II
VNRMIKDETEQANTVVVTGLGMVTSVGLGTESTWKSIVAGKSGIREVDLFDVSGFQCQLAAQLPVDFESNFPDQRGIAIKRVEAVGLAAAGEAAADAGLSESQSIVSGIVFAGGSGSILEIENMLSSPSGLDGLQDGDIARVQYRMDRITDLIAQDLGGSCARSTVVTACSSGAVALGLAYDRIRSGFWKVALVGASDVLSRLCFGGFNTLRSMDSEPCRPFDLNRKGMTLGEGAGALVLESEDSARKRNAEIYAVMSGYGSTSDAFHMTGPDVTGTSWARAVQAALDYSGISGDSIDYINAHGTATPMNDRAETAAFKRVFGDNAYHIPISSVKSMIGHCQFASGAIEAVLTVLATRQNVIPSTVNLSTPDPDCDLDYVPEGTRYQRVNHALSCSFGFGGSSTVLVFSSMDSEI